MADKQIYSATYSNVPVFEFITLEGPIMRRKHDLWINATHILKIARFPKAKRTRILEKDVQTGIHEKVQGGYGKYQGTYVPLDLGADIARQFGVYEVLRPMFEFQYIEGKSETPPPAPKHSHALASNVAKRQASVAHDDEAVPAKRTRTLDDVPRRRGRPKRVALPTAKPALKQNKTTLILEPGPSIGTFKDSTPGLARQDTEQDALQVMASNMSVRNDDLELDATSDEGGRYYHDDDELMSVRELFGTPRDSFERIVQHHNRVPSYHMPPLHDPYYEDQNVYLDYFKSLLNYLSDDTGSKVRLSLGDIPERLLNPPQPLLRININQPIDNDGNTLFHWACLMGNIAVVEFLLSLFSNINSDLKNYLGETPLMFLVKFINLYQLKNFPALLDLLFDLILSIDNKGKTVLHHVALVLDNKANTPLQKNKERFLRYYMECIFRKIIEFQGFSLLSAQDKKPSNLEDKQQLVHKFINHQDNDGNTAFHIVAYHLNKKCVKVFIANHKYIDFLLRNLVNYTVEDYLASHNFVLRLEGSGDDATHELVANGHANGAATSVESQLYYSKLAINLQNTTSNAITEKLTELSYTIDKELRDQDAALVAHQTLVKHARLEQAHTQRDILRIFKLEYLLDGEIKPEEKELTDSDADDALVYVDLTRDDLIQEEVDRLVNDVSFQVLTKQEQLREHLVKFNRLSEQLVKRELAAKEKEASTAPAADAAQLALELQRHIVRRRALSQDLTAKQGIVPVSSYQTPDEKENDPPSVIANYSKDDRLYKYCKLVSLCCGMSFTEVENSIDLIEQSLAKTDKTK